MKTHCSSCFLAQITNYFILHHSNYWSFCPFWCCLLFQWYIATIGTWFPIWFSICCTFQPMVALINHLLTYLLTYLYLESRTIGFHRIRRLLMMD